jgi:hypothetical protein
VNSCPLAVSISIDPVLTKPVKKASRNLPIVVASTTLPPESQAGGLKAWFGRGRITRKARRQTFSSRKSKSMEQFPPKLRFAVGWIYKRH